MPRLDLFPASFAQLETPFVIGDFRHESRIVGVSGEGDMHFAQSPADHRHKLVEESEGVWRLRARLLLERGVLERAPEVVHYPSPGVALIWDGALDDEERVGRAFGSIRTISPRSCGALENPH